MTPLQLAGMLPSNPQFRAWLEHISVPPEAVTADQAAEFIRVVCKVASRREIASDAQAEQRFHQYVRRPFVAWRDQQH